MKSRAFQHTQKFTESPQSLAPLNSDFCPVKGLLNQDPAIWQFGFVKSLVHFLQGVGIETRRSTCHPNVGRDRKTLAVEPGSGYLQSGLFLYKEIYCGETRCSETQTGFNHAPVESCSGYNFLWAVSKSYGAVPWYILTVVGSSTPVFYLQVLNSSDEDDHTCNRCGNRSSFNQPRISIFRFLSKLTERQNKIFQW